VVALRDNPLGNIPEIIDHVYGPIPPNAVRVYEYGVGGEAVPLGKLVS
jgi:hypothetical protein